MRAKQGLMPWKVWNLRKIDSVAVISSISWRMFKSHSRSPVLTWIGPWSKQRLEIPSQKTRMTGCLCTTKLRLSFKRKARMATQCASSVIRLELSLRSVSLMRLIANSAICKLTLAFPWYSLQAHWNLQISANLIGACGLNCSKYWMLARKKFALRTLSIVAMQPAGHMITRAMTCFSPEQLSWNLWLQKCCSLTKKSTLSL